MRQTQCVDVSSGSRGCQSELRRYSPVGTSGGIGVPDLTGPRQVLGRLIYQEDPQPAMNELDKAGIAANGELDLELQEWLDSLDYVLDQRTPEEVQYLLAQLQIQAEKAGVRQPSAVHTPYINSIPRSKQPPYPGSREIERRIKSLVRWNAMAMVVRANHDKAAPGGHISTYASAATLYEVGFNHFFRGKDQGLAGDQIYFQGHAAPGIYARAFLEGRLTEQHLENFRRELRPGGGLSSYPHPWLMPSFWEFPTVSMGLGPLLAAYQARFNRYLQGRGLKDTSPSRVWAFLGDGGWTNPRPWAPSPWRGARSWTT